MTEPRTTQTQHPWRATARTAVAALIGFVPLFPQIVDATDLSAATPWVALGLSIAGGVTRVLAIPAFEEWLSRFFPLLAADPASSAWHAGKLPQV